MGATLATGSAGTPKPRLILWMAAAGVVAFVFQVLRLHQTDPA